MQVNLYMRFQVPQNVQREDTIFLNVTFKQLGVVLLGAGLAYSLYLTLYPLYTVIVWGPAVGFVIIMTLVFAFVKISHMTFINYLLHLIEFLLKPRTRFFSHKNLIYTPKYSDTYVHIDPKLKKQDTRKGDLSNKKLESILDKINVKHGE